MNFSVIEREFLQNGRIAAERCVWLFDPACDLHVIGRLADAEKRRRYGNRVFWRRNLHVNPTNVCRLRCPLCAFSRDADAPDAFFLSEDVMVHQVEAAVAGGATEVHVVGGLHPAQSYEGYLRLIGRIHREFPTIAIKAWTAQEIFDFAQSTSRTVESILMELWEAGLRSLPGGGAEIFAPAVREQISPQKIDAETWLNVHRAAHRLGMKTSATILFGHLETSEERADHLLRLRTLQDETGGFTGLVPLAFHPEGTGLADRVAERPTPAESLRMIAAARLILDNFPHIRAYWVSLGIPTAQLALGYGADDFDGTVGDERIHHEAGATSPRGLGAAQLERLIRETGAEPFELTLKVERQHGVAAVLP